MGIDFKPQNALEQAIYDHNGKLVIYAYLMIKILTGKPVSADEPWYPENDES